MRTDLPKLKTCPFCGRHPFLSSDGGCKDFVVSCSCGASIKYYGFDTKELCIEVWNRRDGPDEARNIDTLESSAAKMRKAMGELTTVVQEENARIRAEGKSSHNVAYYVEGEVEEPLNEYAKEAFDDISQATLTASGLVREIEGLKARIKQRDAALMLARDWLDPFAINIREYDEWLVEMGVQLPPSEAA